MMKIKSNASHIRVKLLSQVETLSKIDDRISKKDISSLKSRVNKLLDAVPKKDDVPELDTIK